VFFNKRVVAAELKDAGIISAVRAVDTLTLEESRYSA